MAKIYVREMNIKGIDVCDLDKYLIKSTNEYYMYSDDNIYKIMSHKINKLIQIDHTPIQIKVDNLNIIIDKSRYILDKSQINHIPFNHEIRKILKREYKLNPLSEIKLVIERSILNSTDDLKKIKVISDYYFVLNEGIYEVDNFIKENIHSFLSLLRNV